MTSNVTWKSRWTFILAATGSAVGLGNIWKFPYITGEYGGGAFVLVYLGCILLIGVPVMIAEIMVGRAGRSDPVHSMSSLGKTAGRSGKWGAVGAIGILAGLMIMMFYSVVAGWALDYVAQSLSGSYLQKPTAEIEQNFSSLLSNPSEQFLWHTIFSLITASIVAGGVTNGIGKSVDILMPILFGFLLLLLGYSWINGDFSAGLHFMFDTDFSKLSSDAILVAMGHAFFTLSLGMGAIMAYGAYFPGKASIGKTVLTIAALDTVIALVAGMAMFPLVFANDLTPGQGPGLMFVTLPIAFSNMAGGQFFGTIFFALVSIAALSSSISLIEPGVAWLEKYGIKRPLSTFGFTGIAWLGGIACIYYGEVFDALDYLTANIMLPLGGLMIALFVGRVMPRKMVAHEVGMDNSILFKSWWFVLRYLAPIGIILVFLNSLKLI
ncbi:sodium-dependent transporter [uncultured Zhongshania sp.]|jgi:NSS family neurotransmitter:Na+ symporter|uniref:sodium-dependent transporter n=1 Tax=uncultured Zhongshania sp. TaxID=1642288 RepID=UPI0025F82FCD|nr:sodium-dependent transporter [uncultured Zhongshania sp.]|tara:strand:+ start:525 stop:1835 length:1311 start_codon:yes stop_codon:yes gene_type:complete